MDDAFLMLAENPLPIRGPPELAALTAAPRPGEQDIPEQWLVLVTCRNEQQQVELLERFRREGLECKALLS